jgi:hypothetical protein
VIPSHTDESKRVRYLLLTLISLIIIASSSWLYQLPTTGELKSEVAFLKKDNNALLKQNNKLKKQFAVLTENLQDHEQAFAIQKVTHKELQHRLTTLQDEVIDLNRELDFYQNITQGNTSTKLQIRELALTADDKHANRFNYRLVITQGKKITKPMTGTIKLLITGEKDSKDETTAISEHQLKLRHVQVLNGQIKLADGMQPKAVKITLKQNKKITLSKGFDWEITPSPTQSER